MKARSLRTVSPPSTSTFSPSASPLALTVNASSGRLSLPVVWNGPESSAVSSPPLSPLELTFSETSPPRFPLPSKVRFSITFCGSSLLPPPPPPQALRIAASAAKIASRTTERLRLKGFELLRFGNGGRGHNCTRQGGGTRPEADHSPNPPSRASSPGGLFSLDGIPAAKGRRRAPSPTRTIPTPTSQRQRNAL